MAEIKIKQKQTIVFLIPRKQIADLKNEGWTQPTLETTPIIPT